MRIKIDQLDAQLARALAPIYLIGGDEPQQRMEAVDAVRAQVRAQGVVERQLFVVGPNFDWQQLVTASRSLSLFAQRQLVELYLPEPKPGNQGSKVLLTYAQRAPANVVLLIQTGRLAPEVQRTSWFTALDKVGVVVQVWPLTGRTLLGWLKQRMQVKGLQPTGEALQLLAERIQGNLPAAVQEIEKLRLLHGTGSVNAQDVLAAVTDNARFDVFDLLPAVFGGNGQQAVQTLAGLEGEGVDPVLVNWALTREVRELAGIALSVARGESAAQCLAKINPAPRRSQLQQAWLQQPGAVWLGRLQHCARVDRVIKGQDAGNPWEELLHLCGSIGGWHPFGEQRSVR